MNLSGNYVLPLSQERTFALLQDPVVLARCMPGCEALDRAGEHEYHMRLKMVIASIAGHFEGKVRIADLSPPGSFRLIVEGAAKIGFMKGEGLLTFTPEGTGTNVKFEGQAEVGGTLANVGQRVVETTARMLIKRFFEKLATFAGLLVET